MVSGSKRYRRPNTTAGGLDLQLRRKKCKKRLRGLVPGVPGIDCAGDFRVPSIPNPDLRTSRQQRAFAKA